MPSTALTPLIAAPAVTTGGGFDPPVLVGTTVVRVLMDPVSVGPAVLVLHASSSSPLLPPPWPWLGWMKVMVDVPGRLVEVVVGAGWMKVMVDVPGLGLVEVVVGAGWMKVMVVMPGGLLVAEDEAVKVGVHTLAGSVKLPVAAYTTQFFSHAASPAVGEDCQQRAGDAPMGAWPTRF